MSVVASSVAILLISGCGGVSDQPELGDVSGKITMDGKPLIGVNILFIPDSGRPAGATTDAEGNYQLEYVSGVSGTKLGSNRVVIEWPTGVDGSVAIPARYGQASTTKVEIKAGTNKMDYALESK